MYEAFRGSDSPTANHVGGLQRFEYSKVCRKLLKVQIVCFDISNSQNRLQKLPTHFAVAKTDSPTIYSPYT